MSKRFKDLKHLPSYVDVALEFELLNLNCALYVHAVSNSCNIYDPLTAIPRIFVINVFQHVIMLIGTSKVFNV